MIDDPKVKLNKIIDGKIMNINQSEKLISEIQRWYVSEIHGAAEKVGGLESLSIKLGYSNKYLFRVLTRNSFSALRRVVKAIHRT